MRVTGLTTNLPVAGIDAARGFYTDYLELNVEEMNLGWVARYRSPDGREPPSSWSPETPQARRIL